MLKAVGIPHAVVAGPRGRRQLVVPVRDALRARQHLQAYETENLPRPAPPPLRLRTRGLAGLCAYAAVLLGVQLARQAGWLSPAAVEGGLVDGEAVRDGELWRLVTALTLHADWPHLVSNLVFGGLFGLLLAQLAGNGVAWASILAGGALGNGLNVLMRAEPHRSLGASTAVFAAVGLLMMEGFHVRSARGGSRLVRWAPVGLGLGLLGWLGTSGERTDLPAHLTGLVCGLLLGLTARRAQRGQARPAAVQFATAASALAVLVLCWSLALALD